MRDLNREHEWIIEKNPPLRTYDDYREMVSRAIAAEAALAAKTDECERLREELLKMQIKGCLLVQRFGEPEVIDGKCSGYCGKLDEPHDKCQECKINMFWEDEEE